MTDSTKHASRACWRGGWPLERALFALAGTLIGVSVVLTLLVSEWFSLIAGFAALNMLAYAAAGTCGAAFFLSRFGGLRSGFDR